MWRNYLTVGLRALAKNKTYAFINIFGLAVGMAACLMILLYVRHELSYDRWLSGADRVYQLQSKLVMGPTKEETVLQMAPYPAGPALQKDFPQVDKIVHAQFGPSVIIRNGQAENAEGILAVDGPFFDVLPLPFVKGDPETALAQVGSVVLTETAAAKYFGNVDPLGQTLTIKEEGGETDYRVTGVLRDLPKNSHLDFTMLARADLSALASGENAWSSFGGFTYVKLLPGADPEAIHAAMPTWKQRNIPGDGTNDNDWRLVNVQDVHLSEAEAGLTPTVERDLIITFAIVAVLILAMACINFTNLATARAGQRAREVALRKVLGASRRQLVVQFLGESLLLAAVAMMLALAVAELLLPSLSGFLEADLSLQYFGEDSILLPIIGLVLLVGLAGGLYPAFYLSRFQPAQVLKANASSGEAPGSGRLRTGLVIAQFAISIGLIVCTTIVYGQTVFARSVDPGFKRDGVLQIENVGEVQDLSETFARQVAQVEGVTSVGRTTIGVSTGVIMKTSFDLPGFDEPVQVDFYSADGGFFETMGIKVLAGRVFDDARPMDDATAPPPSQAEANAALSRRGLNIVVNDSAAKRLGYSDPAAAVGKSFRTELLGSEPTTTTIIGVVQDSRFRSVRDPVEPIIFRFDRSSLPYLVARYEAADPVRVREDIEGIWKRLASDIPFEAEFTEDVIQKLYDKEEARGQIFAAFAIVAILISSLGLYGLAAFTAERRTKEIGIRKVLGARVRDIVRLLAWQFSKPVVIANLIAWPVAWWVMRDWLNGFDARLELGPGPFVLAGLLAFVIAIGTVAGHAIKVARLNPIHALRYE